MWLDEFPREEIEAALHRCLASDKWIDGMMHRVPFGTSAQLYQAAFETFAALNEADWLQAFAHHPKIGARVASPASTPAGAAGTAWSAQEQSGMGAAGQPLRDKMVALNEQYEQKFGFIYLVNATGKSAEELLQKLEQRLPNAREVELPIAANELKQIMRIRLEKLISERGPITTHVLDQALGKPAANVEVTLSKALPPDSTTTELEFVPLATRRTDKDGRVGHFLMPGVRPEGGTYRLRFALQGYPGAGFFPFVDLHFAISQPEQHHHVPLLLSPFGFATYRGS